ncbi:hypothetical protein MSL71_13520 [Desulfoluna butyratoxydans]|uniref:Uncharacterized protein n=1 Tax=Desulfoluna butyratoxydans TaxID=231438 RepID=A0A4U8YJA6_9BACT|nr:hypothetical protein MSL71_13520 [Desulfoluna butyratoxydans]
MATSISRQGAATRCFGKHASVVLGFPRTLWLCQAVMNPNVKQIR